MLCPCCRQELPPGPGLNVSLDTNHAAARGRFVQLAPDHTALLDALARAWPIGVAHERLVFAIWGHASPDGALKTMRVQINRLRKAIQPLGYSIASVWGEGYRLIDQGTPAGHAAAVSINTSSTNSERNGAIPKSLGERM